MVEEAVDRMLNSNEVDNFTNIVQAHQLPDCLNDIANTLASETTIRSLRNTFHPKKRIPLPRSISKEAKRFAGLHLAWSFGLKPLLNDIKTLQKRFRSLKDDLRKTRTNAGKPVTTHLQVEGDMALISSGRIGSTHYNKYLVNTVRPLRIVSVKAVKSAKFESPILQDLDSLLGKYGANGPASFVWEQIPYSFVVDWFVNTKPIMNHLDNLLTGGRREILDVCVSEKYAATIGGAITCDYTSVSFPPGTYEGTPCFWSDVSFYTRYPSTYGPKLSSAEGRFGKSQLALGLSLIIQKVAKR
jgi:hypothetical protein